MTISGVVGDSRWAEAVRTAYIVPGLALEVRRRARNGAAAARLARRVGALLPKEQTLPLKLGDALILTRSQEPGRPAEYDDEEEGHPPRADRSFTGGVLGFRPAGRADLAR